MDRPRMLSGEELVLRGVTKIDATLPEIGMKDVLPNWSWLEQKQIQAALEARKHLVEVERIEKCGTLSHAEWREDLMLGEVTQQAGGYWQYLGHHVGKKLYLKPEEALFLMEVNCLLLKHNEVTVSLQKAYSLLLGNTISLMQYKVYASLSRLGYKTYRHQKNKGESNKEQKSTTEDIQKKAINDSEVEETVNKENLEINVDANAYNNLNYNHEPTNIINIDGTEKEKFIEVNENNLTNNKTTNMETDVNEDNACNEENGEFESRLVVVNLDPSVDNNEQIKNKELVSQDEIITLNNVPEKYCNIIEVEDLANQNGNDINNVKINMDTEIQNNNMENTENDNISSNTSVESHITLQLEPQTNTGVLTDVSKKINNQANEVNTPMEADSNNSEIDSGCNVGDSIGRQENQMSIPKNIETFESKLDNTNLDSLNENWNSVAIKLQKLRRRQLKHANTRNLHEVLENIPDLFQKEIVTVSVPEEQYIPRNIFVNNTAYVLNLETVTKKPDTPRMVESANYNTYDVNESHIRRLRSSSRSDTPQNSQISQLFPHMTFPRLNAQFRPYNYWRPRNHSNYFHFNMFFQRPFHGYFMPRFHYQGRPNTFWRPYTNPNNYNLNSNRVYNTSNVRKRERDSKIYHLQAIKSLAARLKVLVLSGNTQVQNIQSLQRLIDTYNSKYMCRLRLTEDFDIIDDATIVDTIELEDEEETSSKKPRLDEDTFKENLNNLRQLAERLRDLGAKGIAFARHRRALSNAIKTFNKSFNADIYLNRNYDVIDRKHITLDSSSDSDCVAKEYQNSQKRKKLRNPFNILKRLSEKHNAEQPSTSKSNENREIFSVEAEENECDSLQVAFDKNWLPNDDDFGRKEVVPKQLMHSRLMDCYTVELLYEFLNNDSREYDNWVDAKVAFFKYIEDTNEMLKNEHTSIQNKLSGNESPLNSLIGPQDCTDMPSVLSKLRIISRNKEIVSETNICIDFDVYNRDVQNFRKSNRPRPHFRVVCVDESSNVPTAAEVCALHSNYDDNVCIVFAIVGSGSISYLQINPTDLPVYIPNNDIP